MNVERKLSSYNEITKNAQLDRSACLLVWSPFYPVPRSPSGRSLRLTTSSPLLGWCDGADGSNSVVSEFGSRDSILNPRPFIAYHISRTRLHKISLPRCSRTACGPISRPACRRRSRTRASVRTRAVADSLLPAG